MEWHLQSDAFGNVLTRGRRLSGPPVKCLYCFAHRCKETPSKLILLLRGWRRRGTMRRANRDEEEHKKGEVKY